MWQCPKCESKNLDVEISTMARLNQHGADDFETATDEAEDQSHEWGDTSLMQCRDCGHSATAKEFEVEADEDEEPVTPTCCKKHQDLGYDDGGFCFGKAEATHAD
jgi:Zn finger protein HypA/HybF involved in hydrogenase expression